MEKKLENKTKRQKGELGELHERVEVEKHLEKSWKIKQIDKRVELGKLPERVEVEKNLEKKLENKTKRQKGGIRRVT